MYGGVGLDLEFSGVGVGFALQDSHEEVLISSQEDNRLGFLRDLISSLSIELICRDMAPGSKKLCGAAGYQRLRVDGILGDER